MRIFNAIFRNLIVTYFILISERKEADIQTTATNTEGHSIMQSISKITITKKQDPITIPGFDNNSMPALEIKTMNMNEISVKHCVANIMVHFDVTVPNEPVINLKRSSSFIPLDGTESKTKIFKCKTSLINAMLPAELCSILPKMMWNIIKSGQAFALPPIPVGTTVSNLSTITEITRFENPPEPLKFPFLPHLRMTLELQKLVNGCYPKKIVSKRDNVNKCHAKYNIHLATDLLPRFSRSNLFDCQAKPATLLENGKQIKPYLAPEKKTSQLNTCMALQPYPASEIQFVASKRFDLTSLQKIRNYISENMTSCSRVFNYFDKNITINLTSTNYQGLKNKLSINIGRLMSDTFDKTSYFAYYKRELPAIQCIELKAPFDQNIKNQSSVSNKSKKKAYIKLYRKCKSTSNISAEKSSTPLSKITCLDEFFQALGTAKLFSGVFDNIYGHKILSSVREVT